jgi:hypothetical protein
MLDITIPGYGELRLSELVLDYKLPTREQGEGDFEKGSLNFHIP